jgi:hypothetical protein
MNDNYRARPPEPGPACTYFAPLLPLLGQERLNPADAHRLRQHLATCGYCQSELDSYGQMDDLLIRHFGPVPRGPLSSADIRELTSAAYRPRINLADPLPEPASSNHHKPRRSAPFRPTRPQPARRRRGMVPLLSAIAAVLVIAAVGLALFASGGRFFSNTANPTPVATVALPVYTPGGNDLFTGIAMVSPNEGWIVGGAFTPASSNAKPLILHYLNGRLYQVNYLTLQGTNADTTMLTQAGMLSATEGWAMGTYQVGSGCDNTLFLRYTGGRWKQGSIIPSTTLTSITLTSPTNGWAIGLHDALECHLGASELPMLYHYDGKKWSPVAVPSGTISLSEVVMTSASNGWAIGERLGNGIDPNPGLLLHYNGKSWSEVNVPDAEQLGIVAFDNIAMASATDGWLLGRILQSNTTASISPYASAGTKTVFFHFNGKQWQKASTLLDSLPPLVGSHLALAPDGSGWLASEEPGNPSTFIFLHLSDGVWNEVANPLGLYLNQIAPLSADDAWAVSNDEKGTYLLHYHNGAWESVPLTSAPTSTPTPTPTGTANAGACTSHSDPTGAADTPGATVTPVPVTSWATYTNTTYGYQLLYPTNWALENIKCPDSAYLAFLNYNDATWNDSSIPANGIKIELYALPNQDHLTASQFMNKDLKAILGGSTCPSYTRASPQVDGREALEVTCPASNLDIYYIPDGASMLKLAQVRDPDGPASDTLVQMVTYLTFTN